MSWQELVEHGAELGTTMVLDTLALNAIGGFANKTGLAVVSQLSKAMENGALFSERYAVEVAGFGKLIIEEGPEAVTEAIKDIARFKASSQESIAQTIKNSLPIKSEFTKPIDTNIFNNLKSIGSNIWQSPGGVIYGYDKKFGNRIQHVLAHATNDPNKMTHTVFKIPKDKIIELVDEAWAKKGAALASDPGAYIVNMGKVIGTKAETAIKIIVKPRTNEIITAYPIKL